MRRSIVCRAIALSACICLIDPGASLAACVGSAVPTARLAPITRSFLGATIISPNDIWLVGSANGPQLSGNPDSQVLTEHWNGSSWVVVPAPYPDVPDSDAHFYYQSSALTGVAAISRNDVWAVGASQSNHGYGPLVEHWNGSQWSIVPAPTVGLETIFDAVSASSPTNVWVAGEYLESGFGWNGVTESWNGKSWTVETDPNSYGLSSISALSAKNVWATGGQVEHWNGTRWNIQSNLHAGAIDAVSNKDVWILGGNTGVAHFDGTTWTSLPLPLQASLESISADSLTDAWIVGQADGGAVTEHWDGSAFTVVPSPQAGSSSALTAIDVRHGFAIAVGYDVGVKSRQPTGLDEFWDGSRWKLGRDVDIESESNALTSVYASAPNDAWAGGVTSNGTLMEHWDGVAWSVVPFAHHIRDPEVPIGVTAMAGRSATDVWAIGPIFDACLDGDAAGAAHWDGRRWRFVNPHICGTARSSFSAIQDFGPGSVWAVGEYVMDDGTFAGDVPFQLAARFNGRRWTAFKNLPDDPETGGFTAVGGASPDDVWAAGQSVGSSSGLYALMYHWNGSAWSDRHVQNPLPFVSFGAFGVVNANDIWLVGGQHALFGPLQPLIEHWNGYAWGVVAHAPAVAGAFLNSVAVIAANDIWATGEDPTGPHVEHWDGRSWSTVTNSLVGQLSGVAVIPGTNAVWAVGDYPTPYFSTQSGAALFHC